MRVFYFFFLLINILKLYQFAVYILVICVYSVGLLHYMKALH